MGNTNRSWIIPLAVVLVLCACYATVLRAMAAQWLFDEDMSHGLVVPFVIAWVVWRERERWGGLPRQGSWWGVVLLALGAALHAGGALGGVAVAGAVGLIVSGTGAILALGGFAWVRVWAFPLVLSLFMVPKPSMVYDQATLPLQLMAARMAAWMLAAIRVGVVRDGNVLTVNGHSVAVAEACNGIRYLLPLVFSAVLFAYMADQKVWMRWALGLAAIPLAIFANSLRVAAAAYVPALAVGALHTGSGWVIFVLCLPALGLVRYALNLVAERTRG